MEQFSPIPQFREYKNHAILIYKTFNFIRGDSYLDTSSAHKGTDTDGIKLNKTKGNPVIRLSKPTPRILWPLGRLYIYKSARNWDVDQNIFILEEDIHIIIATTVIAMVLYKKKL